jgi:hypothetical protein
VLDVGRGTGPYATWLAARGYTVHLVDPVPLHVDQARARSAHPHGPARECQPGGDARRLHWHRPDELEHELTEAGFAQTRVLAIEGPAWLLQDFDGYWDDPMLREILLDVVRRTEAEARLLGASSHLGQSGARSHERIEAREQHLVRRNSAITCNPAWRSPDPTARFQTLGASSSHQSLGRGGWTVLSGGTATLRGSDYPEASHAASVSHGESSSRMHGESAAGVFASDSKHVDQLRAFEHALLLGELACALKRFGFHAHKEHGRHALEWST